MTWAQEHPERMRVLQHRWREQHPERRRAIERKSAARPERQADHRARERARYQSLSLPEQYALASNRYVRTRLHRMESVTAAFLPMADECVYCGGEQTGWDHVIPLSRGGAHTEGNLVPCCRPCNSSKGCLTPDEWLARGLIRGWNPGHRP